MKDKTALKNRIKKALKTLVMFFINPRLLLCVGIAWLITNGWSYLFVALGAATGVTWMTVAGAAYMGFLWFPFTPEKLMTFLIAIALMKLFFPKDERTLGVLEKKYRSLKTSFVKRYQKAKEKSAEKRKARENARAQTARKRVELTAREAKERRPV